MATQILPQVWFQGDIEALKKNLDANATGTDLGVQACTSLPDTTRAAWGVFLVGLRSYSRSSTGFWTTGSEANQGQELERQLYAWQLKLKDAGCTLGAPAVDPQPPEPPGSSVFRWLAVAFIVGAAAVATHEIVTVVRDIVPERRPREPELEP